MEEEGQETFDSGSQNFIGSLDTLLNVDALPNLEDLSRDSPPALSRPLSCDTALENELDVDSSVIVEQLSCEKGPENDVNFDSSAIIDQLSCEEAPVSEVEVDATPELESLSFEKGHEKEVNVESSANVEQISCEKDPENEMCVDSIAELDSLSCEEGSENDVTVDSSIVLEQLPCEQGPENEMDVDFSTELDPLSCKKEPEMELNDDSSAVVETLFSTKGPDMESDVDSSVVVEPLASTEGLEMQSNVDSSVVVESLSFTKEAEMQLNVDSLTVPLCCEIEQEKKLIVDLSPVYEQESELTVDSSAVLEQLSFEKGSEKEVNVSSPEIIEPSSCEKWSEKELNVGSPAESESLEKSENTYGFEFFEEDIFNSAFNAPRTLYQQDVAGEEDLYTISEIAVDHEDESTEEKETDIVAHTEDEEGSESNNTESENVKVEKQTDSVGGTAVQQAVGSKASARTEVNKDVTYRGKELDSKVTPSNEKLNVMDKSNETNDAKKSCETATNKHETIIDDKNKSTEVMTPIGSNQIAISPKNLCTDQRSPDTHNKLKKEAASSKTTSPQKATEQAVKKAVPIVAKIDEQKLKEIKEKRVRNLEGKVKQMDKHVNVSLKPVADSKVEQTTIIGGQVKEVQPASSHMQNVHKSTEIKPTQNKESCKTETNRIQQQFQTEIIKLQAIMGGIQKGLSSRVLSGDGNKQNVEQLKEHSSDFQKCVSTEEKNTINLASSQQQQDLKRKIISDLENELKPSKIAKISVADNSGANMQGVAQHRTVLCTNESVIRPQECVAQSCVLQTQTEKASVISGNDQNRKVDNQVCQGKIGTGQSNWPDLRSGSVNSNVRKKTDQFSNDSQQSSTPQIVAEGKGAVQSQKPGEILAGVANKNPLTAANTTRGKKSESVRTSNRAPDKSGDVDMLSDDDDDFGNEVDDSEVSAWLDAGLEQAGKDTEKEAEIIEKIILEEKGEKMCDMLPEGWVKVSHHSGMPVYLHKATRVCCMSRPYNLGSCTVRRHHVPQSAIPCLHYKRELEKEQKQEEENKAKFQKAVPAPSAAGDASAAVNGNPSQSNAEKTDNQQWTKEDLAMSVVAADSMPFLDVEAIRDYCKSRFIFRSLAVKKFKSWKDKKNHFSEERRKQQKKIVPTLAKDLKLITRAVNAKDKANQKKEHILNPVGKTPACILHEFTQQVLKVQPTYEFKEIENSETPYKATVIIGEIQYGSGVASGKKQAKAEAAKATLEIFLPSIASQWKDDLKAKTKYTQDTQSNLAFFEEIHVEDPRVADLCEKAALPKPFEILQECLKRNFGMGDTSIHLKQNMLTNQKSEFHISVGKHSATVSCKNKREGRQRAAQAILQLLHPKLSNWASLLRLYSNVNCKSYKEMADDDDEEGNTLSNAEKNFEILKKLKEAMRKVKRQREIAKDKSKGETLQAEPLDL